jgi:hypothetical protein
MRGLLGTVECSSSQMNGDGFKEGFTSCKHGRTISAVRLMNPNPSPQDLEDFWREKAYQARRKYNQASSAAHEVMKVQRFWPLPAPHSSVSVSRALEAESKALAEYLRVLKISNDLIIYGKIPEPE